MSSNPLPSHPIPDELLSAYLDDEVSADERRLVEEHIVRDADVAWRLDSLRQTVMLVRAMPQVSLPRTFSLESILAAEAALNTTPSLDAGPSREAAVRPVAPRPAAPTARPADGAKWWETLFEFLRGGSPLLRNAAAVAFTLFVVVGLGIQATGMPLQAPASETFAILSQAEMAAEAPAAADAAPAAGEPNIAIVQEPADDSAGDSARATEAGASPAESVAAAPAEDAFAAKDNEGGAPAAEAEILATLPVSEEPAAEPLAEPIAEPPAMAAALPAPGGVAAAVPGGVGGLGGGADGPPAAAPEGMGAAAAASQAQGTTGMDIAIQESTTGVAASAAPAPVAREARAEAAAASEPLTAAEEPVTAATEEEAPAAENAAPAVSAADVAMPTATAETAATPTSAPTIARLRAEPTSVALARPEPLSARRETQGGPAAQSAATTVVNEAAPLRFPLLLVIEVALGIAALLLTLLWLRSRRA